MKFEIADARDQLVFARELANARVPFMVIPIVTEEERCELSKLCLKNIEAIDKAMQEKS